MGCPKYYLADWQQSTEALTLVIDPCTSAEVTLRRRVIVITEEDEPAIPAIPATALLNEDGSPQLNEDGSFALSEE